MSAAHQVILDESGPETAEFEAAVIDGLSRPQKTLPCKYLYDQRGSRLFDEICRLEEYYPTRTELAIMQASGPEMAAIMGQGVLLVEYGSGSSWKTRILLDHLESPAGYVPIDISREHLHATAGQLAADYPGIAIYPVWGDYTSPLDLHGSAPDNAPRVVYFPGSTIGNFSRAEALAFLQRTREVAGKDGRLLIGVDLKKDPARLIPAYDDARGVTAAFNQNILVRINRELQANFPLERFEHTARYNADEGRVEMHLVCQDACTVSIGDKADFAFDSGETIWTESSHKYSIEEFGSLCRMAGFDVMRTWCDPDNLFSVHYAVAR